MSSSKQVRIGNLCAWINASAILRKRSDNLQSPRPGDALSVWYLALNSIQDNAAVQWATMTRMIRAVHNVFENIRARLGWTARGGHASPRIHDLRHTFVCRRVQQWHRQGTTIDDAMVALATYVGHAKVSDTYWYLTGVPELMAMAGRDFEQFASRSKEGGRG